MNTAGVRAPMWIVRRAGTAGRYKSKQDTSVLLCGILV